MVVDSLAEGRAHGSARAGLSTVPARQTLADAGRRHQFDSGRQTEPPDRNGRELSSRRTCQTETCLTKASSRTKSQLASFPCTRTTRAPLKEERNAQQTSCAGLRRFSTHRRSSPRADHRAAAESARQQYGRSSELGPLRNSGESRAVARLEAQGP